MPEEYKDLPPKECFKKMMQYMYKEHKTGGKWDEGWNKEKALAVAAKECDYNQR